MALALDPHPAAVGARLWAAQPCAHALPRSCGDGASPRLAGELCCRCYHLLGPGFQGGRLLHPWLRHHHHLPQQGLFGRVKTCPCSQLWIWVAL